MEKNIEGAELLDYGDEEDDNNNDGDNEVEIEESDSDSETEKTPESDKVSLENEITAPVPGVVTLENICNDEAINKDARFVDHTGNVTVNNVYITIFTLFFIEIRNI